MSNESPPQLTLSFYGDDFTGSTDAMEALTCAGMRTVLFLDVPQPAQLQRFEGLMAFGVAGSSRAMSPEEMEAHLPPVFTGIRAFGTPIFHYKTCSTFDSSPEVGSIGRALDLGQAVFKSPFVPVLVGAPILGRHCVFGNLFARSGLESEPYRLDRHPTMSRHPITPMNESDLRLHLGRQTNREIALFDILQLEGEVDVVEQRFARLVETTPEIVLFDVLYDAHLARIGRLIWKQAVRQVEPLYVVGSSGVEYALAAYWRESGLLGEPRTFDNPGAVEQLIVVSGSCSPVTARQIDWAIAHGFADIPLNTSALANPETAASEIASSVERALALFSEGRSVVLHMGHSPDDPRIVATHQQMAAMGYSDHEIKLKSGKLLGEPLGKLLRTLLERTGVRRAMVTGGDTSFHVARQLGIVALEMIGPTAPGSPFCRVYADDASIDKVELVFKGGQLGTVAYFGGVLQGVVV